MTLLEQTWVNWQSFTTIKGRKLWIAHLHEPYPGISGNKIAKLNEPVKQLRDYQGVATFGGAFSNHLLATAVACKLAGKKSLGIVRSDFNSPNSLDPNNPTLNACLANGMQLIAASRQAYRDKTALQQSLNQQHRNYLWVPEGGTSADGVQGVKALNLANTPAGPASHLYCATGSGGTLAGLALGHPRQQVTGIAVVKDNSLSGTIEQYCQQTNWQLTFDFVGKGYGRFDNKVLATCQLASKQNLTLEPIYTGKAFIGTLALIGQLPPNSNPVFFHTGGLQGLNGLRYRGLL